jgi:hypothetical protein
MQHIRQKINTFASEKMKKFCHIIMSVLLSVILLFAGSGITITQCAHTGTIKVMAAWNTGAMDDMSCDMNSSCMSTMRVELSPTNMAQNVSYDFYVIQPVLAVLPQLVADWLVPTDNKPLVQYAQEVSKSPPRAYLNLIQVLQI